MVQPPVLAQLRSARSLLPTLEKASLPDLVTIDETLRRTLMSPQHMLWLPSSWRYPPPVVPAGTKEWWALWQPLVAKEPEVLYVMACAPNGKVRLRACQELARRPSPLALGLLLVRSNDWVTTVREEARSALDDFLTPEYVSWWVEASPLVLRFKQALRSPFPELLEKVHQLLNPPEAAQAVSKGLKSSSVQVKLSLLELLGTAQLSEAVQISLASDDDLQIRRKLVADAPTTVLRLLLKDSAASVRKAAFAKLLPDLPPTHQTPEIRAALLDTRSSIRSQAQYALKQVEEDPLTFYRSLDFSALSQRESRGALGGLADVGQSEDAQLVWSFLNPAEPSRVRAEALRTLALINPVEAAPALWDSLGQSGRQARQAEESLIQAGLVTEQRLQQLWQSGDLHERRAALRLTKVLPRFEAAILAIQWRQDEPLLNDWIDEVLEVVRKRLQVANYVHAPYR